MYSLTDSPDGDYQSAQETVAELNIDVNLSYINNPKVMFDAKWDIESNWDFVRFQAFVHDSGWISLNGQFTEEGSGQPAQPLGEHGYDGLQENWVQESISLPQIDDAQISGFRFIQTSDNFVEGDGFVFDNFTISGYPNGIFGDWNHDMVADIYDILSLADFLLSGDDLAEPQLFFSDLDSNGVVDIMDLILLTNIIMGR